MEPTLIKVKRNFVTPNRSLRRGTKIEGFVLHHDGGNEQGSVSWLCSKESGVSTDIYFAKDGDIYLLNPDLSTYYTWHAGKAKWKGHTNVNQISIGCEFEYVPNAQNTWTVEEILSGSLFIAKLIEDFKLNLDNDIITSHFDVAQPKGRKNDPKSFPWKLFSIAVRGALTIPKKVIYIDK